MSTKKHIVNASTMLIEHGFHVFDEQRTHEQTAINPVLILFNGGIVWWAGCVSVCLREKRLHHEGAV